MSKGNATWTVRGGRIVTPTPFALMGIINITPDSFSDGGLYTTPEKVLSYARSLWNEGATFLDLGAESSRPGAELLSPDEEMRRMLDALKSVMQFFYPHGDTLQNSGSSQPPFISIDTYHAKTVQAVLELGVHCINDISACLWEPEMLDLIVQYKPGYVLMHSTARPNVMQQHIHDDNILKHLSLFFEEHLTRLVKAGVPEENIILDPGIGFGKSVEQNLEVLSNIDILEQFGRPILIGISMKSFLHLALDIDSRNRAARAEASLTMTSLLAERGILYHRVHHVAQCERALRMVHLMQNNRN